MASPRTLLQTIQRPCSSPQERALRYYQVLFLLNGMALQPMELKLLAHTAVRGNISSHTSRAQFMEANNTTKNVVGNLISSLYHKGLLVKEDGKTFVHPQLTLDFHKNLVLNLKLLNEAESA